MEFQGKFYIKKHTLFFVFIFVFFIFAFDSVSPVWAGGLFLSEKKDVYKRYLLRTNFATLNDIMKITTTKRSRRVYFHSMDTGHGPCHVAVEIYHDVS